MTPGLLSGVSRGLTVRSMPASAGDIITETAKPVAALAEVRAHRSLSAVINIRLTQSGKASANVSSTSIFLDSFQSLLNTFVGILFS